jgi:hypothetical protein
MIQTFRACAFALTCISALLAQSAAKNSWKYPVNSKTLVNRRQTPFVASRAPRTANPFAFSFTTAVNYDAGGATSSSVAVADVNGDRNRDIIVANACATATNCNSQTVGVLLGNGDGTFQTAVTYIVGALSNASTASVAAADMNRDHKPDLVVTIDCDTNCGSKTISVLLGNGDGTFQTAVSYDSGGFSSSSVAIADLNADGKPDVSVTLGCGTSTSCTAGSVSVLLGNGDGTVKAAVAYPLVSGDVGTSGVVVADVNADGKPDLLVANSCAESPVCNPSGNFGGVDVLLGNGDGSFQAAVGYRSVNSDTNSVAVGDVNGDGNPDLALSNYCAIGSYCFLDGSADVFLAKGNGTFQNATGYMPGGYGTTSVALGDFDGDGKLDLTASNTCVGVDATCTYNGGTTAAVSVLSGNGDGTFQAAVNYDSLGFLADTVVSADVNGDGRLDLIAVTECGTDPTCASNGSVAVLLNTSTSFGLVPNPAELTVSAGQSGSTTITVYANGNLDPQTLSNWACSGLPANASCSFGTIDSNNQIMLTLATTAASGSNRKTFGSYERLFYAFIFPGVLGVVCLVDRRRALRSARVLMLMFILLTVASWISCGGGSSRGGPGGNGGGGGVGGGTSITTSTVTVSATSGALKPTTTVVLTIQ